MILAVTQFTTTTNYDLVELINRVLAYTILVAGFLSLVFIIWGGLKFITAGGNEDKVKEAGHTIRYAIVGLIIVILSFTAVFVVGRFFNYNLIEYISLESIYNDINSLTSGF